MTLQVHYGLFDPSTNMGGGNYWTWFHEELPLALLNRFYYEIAVKHLAPEPNKLTADDLWGGIAKLDSDWTVLYRIFNGGYDRQDRPGRWVMLTAWIKTSQTTHIDLLPILLNKTFREIAAVSKELPVPSPAALTETCVGTKTQKTLSIPDDNSKKEFGGADAAQQAMEYFASIPPERFASLKIVMTSAEQKVVLEEKSKLSVRETPVKSPMPKPEPVVITTVKPPAKNKPDTVKPPVTPPPKLPREFSLPPILPIATLLAVIIALLVLMKMFNNEPSIPQQVPPVRVPNNNQPQDQIKDMFQTLPPETQERLIRDLQEITKRHKSREDTAGDDHPQ